MANYTKTKKNPQKKIEETDNSNFGNYMESTGGGKPFSTSNTRTTRENGKYRQANNDTKQARTSDGKFTYKSVNGKSIDPKYGPSRGKTVNPLLTGGENGIMIEDVEKQFDAKSGDIWDKYKDKWYRKGATVVLGRDHKTRVAGESIWEIARQRYDSVAKEFGGRIVWDDNARQWVATDEGKESDTFKEVKKGRKSEAEKAAATSAYKTGEQTFVKDSDGGIALKKGVTLPQPGATTTKAKYRPMFTGRVLNQPSTGTSRWKPKQATPTTTTATTPSTSAPSASAPNPVSVNTAQNVTSITNADYTPKYSDSDLADVKTIMKQQGFTDDDIAKFDAMSPKEKDTYIDTYFE